MFTGVSNIKCHLVVPDSQSSLILLCPATQRPSRLPTTPTISTSPLPPSSDDRMDADDELDDPECPDHEEPPHPITPVSKLPEAPRRLLHGPRIFRTSPDEMPPMPSLEAALLAPKVRVSGAPAAKRSASPRPSTLEKRARLSHGSTNTIDPVARAPPTNQPLALKRVTPTPSKGTILVPDSSLPPSVSAFPQFLLNDIVDLDDPLWRETFQVGRRGIRNLGFPGPKSDNQLKALALVLEGLCNFLMVLPTSFGKSILYQAIAALPADVMIDGDIRGGNVIVVEPFTALLSDQAKKTAALGIPTYNWQNRQSLGPVPSNTRAIFIQPESYISREFQT